MKKILLITFLFVSTLLSAQSLQAGYISLKDPYQFNLPVQGVGMSMPSRMGFLLPQLGTHGFLDMDKDVNLFLPHEELNSKLEYKFSILSNNKSTVSLFIFPQKSFFGNTYLERMRTKYGSLERLRSLENDLGTSVSYRCEVKGRLVDSHVYYSEGILYHFVMNKDIAAKDMYESIIRSIRKNSFEKELEKYEEHKKKAYLKKEEKKQDIKDTADEPKLRSIVGKTSVDKVFNYKQEGVKLWMPQNFEYGLNARRLIESEDGEIEVYRAESDKKKANLYNVFGDGSIIYRSKFKNEKDNNAQVFSSRVKGNKSMYAYYKELEVVVDGIKCEGAFFGATYWGYLELWFETDEAYNSIYISGLDAENIAFYDKWLSKVKIQSSAKRVKYNAQKALSSVLTLEDKPQVTLDKLNISNALSPSLGGFRCTLSTLGMGVYLPGKMSDYTYGLATNWGKDILNLGANGETDLAPSDDVFYVAIRSLNQGYKADLTLYLNKGKKFSVKQQTKDTFLYRNTITPPNFDTYVKAGVLTARDGSQWGIMIDESGTKAIIMGRNDVYNIYYAVEAKSPQQLDSILALTHEFTVDKQNPKKK